MHALSATEIPWAKPILRVSNEALFFDRGFSVSVMAMTLAFSVGLLYLNLSIVVFDQGTKLSHNQGVRWQENLKIRIERDLYFDESIKLRLNREFTTSER